MILKHKDGDVLQAPEYFKVHQTNCKGVMGRGLAKQVKEQFPKVFEGYVALCADYPNTADMLGMVQIIDVNNGAIVNLFGEDGYGAEGRHTNYEAFYVALENLKKLILEAPDYFPKREIAFPYKIGSALGGADWNVIYAMIISVFENTDFHITIYHYNG